ncbi:hypothetical protein [Nocardioides jiangxiensis]|uniref:VCBS repeat-containing protein n=1 Tax=Nocardioides jiangxiensis TaxID=3064524 RepID=A0ABT9B4Y2_9ACTN|nr:hypothetical protein [Nocardioides sp. WY-20]MDO7869308.1 hypothetical protein [Nocardioides sp. WY-20]
MKLSKASFAAGAVAALVLGSGTAYAATGGNFILGKSNSAGATTSLTNSNGTPLALTAKSGYAPLKVNSGTKVANLNADRLDGIDSSSFARTSGQTGNVVSNGGMWLDFDNDGYADALVAFVSCPTGTVMTGGGGEDDTPGGTLWLSEPVGPGTWGVSSSTAPANATVPNGTPDAGLTATAQCYNPKGAVSGSMYRPTSPLNALKARLAEKQR